MITLLDVLYALVLLVGSPYWLFRLVTSSRYRKGLAQRFGALPRGAIKSGRIGPARPIWIHCVSVGELNAARTFIDGVEKRFPGKSWIVSCFTAAGFEQARKRYGADRTIYLPIDLTPVASKVLKRINPACIVLVELELWPNFLRRARKLGIPVLVVNGRITERTARRLRWARLFFGPGLRDVPDLYCVQTETYRDRLLSLGVPERRIRVTGTMKYDTVATSVEPEVKQRLREQLGFAPDARLIVGGSTWPGEEEVILKAYARLREEFADLRLLLAPRHIERADEVDRAVRAAGFEPLRRTRMQKTVDTPPDKRKNSVFVLDTLGELAAAYSLATVTFVGKSLRTGGGQNMLEPAALGVPVIYGPQTSNFTSEAELLAQAGAAEVVANDEALYPCLRRLLGDDARRLSMAEAARKIVAENRGATSRHIEALAELVH